MFLLARSFGRTCVQWTPMSSDADNIVNCSSCRQFTSPDRKMPPRPLGKFFHSPQNMRHLQPRLSVYVSMRKTEALRKLTNTKKDARLTIRIPRELKAKIEGIDRVYGVALPKIANECLRAFCDYVEQKKQTPTFPLSIGDSPSNKAPNQASGRKRRGSQNGQRKKT